MAKWSTLPPETLIYQADQMAFLEARRRRICKKCGKEYNAPPDPVCPTCGEKGIRLFDRLSIVAGRRFGKSLMGSIAGAEEASLPSTLGWACAPTNPKLHRYVIPAFQRLIPDSWVEDWDGEFLDLRLKNKSMIHFQTLESPDQGRGQGLDWLWIDEVCELTEQHWNVIRPSLGDKLGAAFFTTSPRSYDWVYNKLVKPAELGESGYWRLFAKTSDNPKFQTPEGIAFLAQEKATMPDVMYRQEYEGGLVTFTGAIYGDAIDPQILHTDDDVRQLIPEWPTIGSWRSVLVGLDTGADHPFGAVKIVSTEKGLVVVGEYLERQKTFIEHAAAIKALGGGGSVRYAINKNERQPTIELAQYGIYCQPAENDVMSGIQRVNAWLITHQLFFAESKCPNTIQELKAYRWAETKARDGQLRQEKAYKLEDELPDALRYALQTWPVLPEPQDLSKKGRDLSGLPGEMRATIERMRRIDKPRTETQSVIGDFFA